MTFEQPQKRDLDRKLSELMHEMRHQLIDECGRLVSEAAARGVRSPAILSEQATAADRLHDDAMDRAAAILFGFIERTGRSPTEVVMLARQHLENLSESLILAVKPSGFPAERERLVRQYRVMFQQRLTSTLRDVEIGYKRPEGFARSPFVVGMAAQGSSTGTGTGQASAIIERRVSERPTDIRDSARALSKAIADQIDQLIASRRNDPDALSFIAFLRQIATGLEDLANTLDGIINTDAAKTRKSLTAKAAKSARALGDFVREGVVEHRVALQACAIHAPVIGGCVLLFHALGVDPTIAFTAVAAIMGVKTATKDVGKG